MRSWLNPASRAPSVEVEAVVLPFAPPSDNAALVALLRADDRAAKAAFFRRYARRVERIITHTIGYDSELPDILQEVFARALASIHRLKDPVALDAWLSRVAALTTRQVLRNRARRAWVRRFVDSAEEEYYDPVDAGPDVEGRRALRAVYAVLGGMSVDERLAFALRHIDGMKLTEVAEACEVSLPTIKRRLARAEQRFLARARNYPALAQWVNGGSPWNDR
jgi:RNA polymerase sigma-70 factor (ECF subfamily)